MYRNIRRVLLTLLVLFTIAAVAVLMALRYWVLPDIEKYHNEVVQLASRAIGMPVTIGKIESGWSGMRPRLVFTDVRLLNSKGINGLVLRRVDNVVSWMTLLSGELRLNSLEIDDPDLVIQRDKQGGLHVAGFDLSEESGSGKLSDWLLHQSQIIVSNGFVAWTDDLYDRPLLVLSHLDIRLDNSGRHHRFAVRVAPPAAMSAPLDVRGDLIGKSFSDRNAWRGELFTQISDADATAWAAWLQLPEEFSRAKGNLRAWLDIEDGQLNRVTADLNLREVQSRLDPNMPMLDLATLNGRVGWHAVERGIEVSTQNLSLQLTDGFVLRPTDFHLRLAGGTENRFAAGEIQANAIELSDIAMLAEYIPLGNDFKQKLKDYSPRGHVTNLRAQWHEGEDHLARFDINARFDGVTMRSIGKIPGVEGLSGHLDGNDGSGTMSINAPKIIVDAPQLFLEPLAFDTFAAEASWQRNRGGWDVKLNNLSAANEDLAGTAYGNYQTDEHGASVVDLKLNLIRASVRHVERYLPKELIGEKTMAWLHTGLQAGEADEVNLRLRGDLNDFPFPENKKGLFQVTAKAKGVVIDYAKDWPRVESATAVLLIKGNMLQVESTSAVLGGVNVQKINVDIPDLMSSEPLLQIHGESSGETKQGLNFIKHSPVRGYIHGFTDNATASGMGKLDLQLDIPLGDTPLKLKGNYHFFDNEISLEEYIPFAHNVTGDLMFTESSLQVKAIGAQMLGGPATLSIQSEADGTLKAKLLGKANMKSWRKTNSAPALKSLNGIVEWGADVSVRDKQYSILVSSNLQGLDSDLPAPLSKNSQEIIPLKFELRSASDSQDVMWLQYGDLVSARMLRADDKRGLRTIKRGYVNFGAAQRVVDKAGVWVSGTLPELSLEGWRDVLQMPGKGGAFPAIDGIDVSVQKLFGYGGAISGLNVHARNRNGIVAAQLASNALNGQVDWFPQDKGKLVIRLQNADFGEYKKSDKEAKIAAASIKSPSKSASKITIPVIDVAIDRLTYKGQSLGRLELHASQFESDILLDSFRLASSDGILQLNGKWGGAQAQTHVVVKLALNNVGKVLERNGFPGSIKDGNGSLDGDLVWAGAPDEFSLVNVDGNLKMKMAKGQFQKLDSGDGKGFDFNSMAGGAQISQGVLSINEFNIDGSVAQIALSGQVDLGRETQSLHALVSPKVGTGVSLLAFAAGPAVGAFVYIANKILRDPLDKLASFEYNVSGSWANPVVEKIGEVKASPQ